ncbi:iron chelate uptake ABC transporter family permease subunit [Chlamydiifrater phoenicopteri]|uniref:metal ABC transporter permease n=1 Tax=Chlamydiifrater phoenicopteri TaxID=2681469 RepID=UPI001BCC109C|nr:iron chelate uptake ABC transporter family permease subunit [Chlamydiifrater phoenicopteri]
MFDFLFSRIFLSSCFSVALVCATASLWGVFLLLSKKSMLPETLSHAAYPGLLLGVLISQGLFSDSSLFLIVLFGMIFAVLGCYGVYYLEKFLKMNQDSALCFILVSFFAFGVILSGYIKDSFPILFNRVNAYLYGQAATLKESDAIVAGCIFFLSVGFLSIFRRQLMLAIFDKDFAETCGIPLRLVSSVTLSFITFIVVIGVRSVGIILISAMFVAPALTSRQLTDNLKIILWMAVGFGAVSGVLGSFLSVALSFTSSAGRELILPTGPLVVLVAGSFVFLSLIFSPSNGAFFRFYRRLLFLWKLRYEHFLKALWYSSSGGTKELSFEDIKTHERFYEYFGGGGHPKFWVQYFLLRKLLEKKGRGNFSLTAKGKELAERLIRRHRLWEVYMVDSLDFSKDDVHMLAEEMEHILTEEMEFELAKMLNNPKVDPHNSIIPERKKGR